MAKKSRYISYYKVVSGKEKAKSTKPSILKRLRELNGQEFAMNIPIEQVNG